MINKAAAVKLDIPEPMHNPNPAQNLTNIGAPNIRACAIVVATEFAKTATLMMLHVPVINYK